MTFDVYSRSLWWWSKRAIACSIYCDACGCQHFVPPFSLFFSSSKARRTPETLIASGYSAGSILLQPPWHIIPTCSSSLFLQVRSDNCLRNLYCAGMSTRTCHPLMSKSDDDAGQPSDREYIVSTSTLYIYNISRDGHIYRRTSWA